MDSNLHPAMQQALRPPMALTPIELDAIDAAMLADKAVDGHGQRNQARAEKLDTQWAPAVRAEGWLA